MIYLILFLMMQPVKETSIFEFKTKKEVEPFRIVNDGVMGGLSQSSVKWNEERFMVFTGSVSLENNGGFASTRTQPQQFELASHQAIKIRLKGDGKTYKFRLRNNDRFDGISFSKDFKTTAGEWEEQTFYFKDMKATFRGRIFPDHPPLQAEDIQQIGFLIADKQKGPFELKVDWIKAIK